jgi:hypothetical protein
VYCDGRCEGNGKEAVGKYGYVILGTGCLEAVKFRSVIPLASRSLLRKPLVTILAAQRRAATHHVDNTP